VKRLWEQNLQRGELYDTLYHRPPMHDEIRKKLVDQFYTIERNVNPEPGYDSLRH